jgi:hypothetical protein
VARILAVIASRLRTMIPLGLRPVGRRTTRI